MYRASAAGVRYSNTISVGSSTPSHSSSSTRKKTDAAESIPRRANLACGWMRSSGVLKVLAKYAMHQSRISDSLGFDFTEHFTVEDQRPTPLRLMKVDGRRSSPYSAAKRTVLIS